MKLSSQIRWRTQGAIIPFFIKMYSAVLSFVITGVLIYKYSASNLGEYAIILALLNALVMLTAVGLPQLIMRETDLVSGSEKYQIYFQKNEATVIQNCIFISIPTCLFFVLTNYSITDALYFCLAITSYSLLKVNFSYLRRSRLKDWSEFFTLLVFLKLQIILILWSNLLFGKLDIFKILALSAFFSNIGQNFACLKLNLKSDYKQVFRVKPFTELLNPKSFKVMLFNISLALKEFLEIFLLGYFCGPASAGIFRIFIQINRAFSLLSNSLNVVKSRRYAVLIQSGKVNRVGHEVLSESYLIAFSMFLILIAVIALELIIGLTDIFPLREHLTYVPLIILSFFPILFGPITQLTLHYNLSGHLAFFSIIRVILVLTIFFFTKDEQFIVPGLVINQLFFMVILSLILHHNFGLRVPYMRLIPWLK